MTYKCHYKTPIGILCIEEEQDAIIGIYMESDYDEKKDRKTKLIEKAYLQLEEYFSGKRTEFHLPIRFQGTEFQKKVWEALRTIPYGETRSYKDIAMQVGNGKACRAVGNANNKNSILIVVPCHRVIGADGSLVGFGGGLEVKEYLLKLEKGLLCDIL